LGERRGGCEQTLKRVESAKDRRAWRASVGVRWCRERWSRRVAVSL
jgi:hypothetical protein